MLRIGRYLLILISLSGLSLSVDDRFSAGDIENFLDYIFRLHNAVRLRHGVGELLRTDEMDAIASQKFSDFMNSRMKHNNKIGVVECSMTFDDTTQLSVKEAMKLFSLFYDQGNFYNYETHYNPFTTDKFTQIVWGDTAQIGLTFAVIEDEYLVLAVYYPCGNIQEQYPSNVLPPQDNLPANDRNIPEIIYKTGREKFLDNLLELHNEKRRIHGVRELIRDISLDEEARSMPGRGSLRPTKDYGVNVLSFGNIIFPLESNEANRVFSTWYDGNKFYNYTIGRQSMRTDSFTQTVWANTEKIGLHVHLRTFVDFNDVRFFNGEYQVIVVYKPPGNIPGQYTSNVNIPRVTEQGESSRNNR